MEQVLHTNRNYYLQANKLVVPSFISKSQLYPKWAFDFVRNEFLQKVCQKPSNDFSKIYISRAHASKRKLLNEDEVIQVLEQYGFQCIHLENLSLADQIHLFQSASTIVAPHGAGLTNLLFCRHGVKLIELFPPNYVKTYFWLLGSYIHMDYYYLTGVRKPPGSVFISGRFDDLIIDTGALTKLLKLADVH